MRVQIPSVAIRSIDLTDKEVLKRWAGKLRPQWGEDSLEQLVLAEFRMGAYLPGYEYPVAYAGITRHGGLDGFDRCAMWPEYYYTEKRWRGHGFQTGLYKFGQVPYMRAQAPERRIFGIPLSLHIVHLWTMRGWVKFRDLPGTPYIHGVYELPRSCL